MQWEPAAWRGPAPGRYVLRRYAGDAAQHVLVIAGAPGAPPDRRGLLRRRAERPPADARVAIVGAVPVEGAPDAWLARAGADEVAAATAVLARALHAHRIAAAQLHAAGAGAPVRVGYGTGDEVARGEWTAARDLDRRGSSSSAPGRGSRHSTRREVALRPQERFAALLAGRDVALAAELLALRARADLDEEHPREAALQLDAALAAALPELAPWLQLSDLAERLEELRTLAPGAAAAAERARAGTLAPEDVEAVAHALGRLEAALRARTAAAPM